MDVRAALAVVAVAACAGCYEDNPHYVDPGADTDSGATDCAADIDCGDGTPACEVSGGTCVQCTSSNLSACAGQVCGEDFVCRACTSHASCTESLACLPDGTCAPAAAVAYVQSGGGSTDCSRELPCASLVTALATFKPVIKLVGPGELQESALVSIGQDVTIVADPGSSIGRTPSGGPLLEVTANAHVGLAGVTLQGGSASANQHLVTLGLEAGGLELLDVTVRDHAQDGIHVSGGELVARRVKLYNNGGNGVHATAGNVVLDRTVVVANDEGGVELSGAAFTITSSVIARNGGPNAAFGGVRLTAPAAGSALMASTIASNVSGTAPNGVTCITGAVFPMQNLIVVGDASALTCSFTHSLFAAALPAMGSENFTGDPAFINQLGSDFGEPDFFRIGAASAALDRGLVLPTVPSDIDGADRGPMPDIGADELNP